MTQSFYIEPPTIPEGMTIAEYRRARHPRRRQLRCRCHWFDQLARSRPAKAA